MEARVSQSTVILQFTVDSFRPDAYSDREPCADWCACCAESSRSVRAGVVGFNLLMVMRMLYKYANSEASILDRYLANLSIEVEPFALCMLDSGWRLTLPGPPCAMLHFVVQGEGWLSCPDGTHKPIGPNWVIVSETSLRFGALYLEGTGTLQGLRMVLGSRTQSSAVCSLETDLIAQALITKTCRLVWNIRNRVCLWPGLP